MFCQLCLIGFTAVGSNAAAHLALAGVLSFSKVQAAEVDDQMLTVP